MYIYIPVRSIDVWRAQIGTTPFELCKLVVPMRVNYAQTMRELVVPMWTLIGTLSCTRLELFVNYA